MYDFDLSGIIEDFFTQFLSYLNMAYEYIADDELQGALIAVYNTLPFQVRIAVILFVFFILFRILLKMIHGGN